jgi:primosomal protein N' (replication factor Y)
MGEPAVLPVVVDAPQHAGLSATLDYRCDSPLPPGSLVQVPLGRRSVPGVVWNRRLGDPADTQQLRSVQAGMPSLAPLGLSLIHI